MIFVSCSMFINIEECTFLKWRSFVALCSLLEELGRKCCTFSCVQHTGLLSARTISVNPRHQMNCTPSISVQGNCCFINSIQLFNLFGMKVTPIPHWNGMAIFHLHAIFFTSSEHIYPAFSRAIRDFSWLFKYRKILDNLFYFVYVPSKGLVFYWPAECALAHLKLGFYCTIFHFYDTCSSFCWHYCWVGLNTVIFHPCTISYRRLPPMAAFTFILDITRL